MPPSKTLNIVARRAWDRRSVLRANKSSSGASRRVLVVVVLGEAQALTDEDARVTDRARQREQVEELLHVRPHGVRAPARSLGRSAPMLAVRREQRERSSSFPRKQR